MTLRTQVGLMLIAVFGCLVAASMFVQWRVIYPSFERLESNLAQTDAERCVQAIAREEEYVAKFAIDWGVWSDMYQFAQDGNREFFEVNLANLDYFRQLNIPVMIVCDDAGRIVHRHVLDPQTFQPIDLALLTGERFSPEHPLMRPQHVSAISGIVLTERAPLLVASRAIFKSDHSGPPIGRFIVGRFLDDRAVASLTEQTRVRFALVTSDDQMPEDLETYRAELLARPGEPLVVRRNASMLSVLRLMPTLVPGETFVLRASMAREITARGAGTIVFGLMTLLLAATCIMLGLIALLQRRVVSPIVALKDHATSVGALESVHPVAPDEAAAKMPTLRGDEIGALACEFNRMIERLAHSQESLAAASRRAGMADVATGVLHNVGNVMNNAAVSLAHFQNTLDGSRLDTLQKVVALLREHQHNLGEFFATDRRAGQVPDLLERMHDSLADERRRLTEDAGRLQVSLDHINEIVRAQQGLATAPEVVEQARISDIIAQAAMLVRPSFDRHHATLNIHVPEDFVVRVDRTRLQQVLVNLLTNALQSAKQVAPERRVVEVSAGLQGEPQGSDRYWIEVCDHGVGFAQHQHDRLFAQGYTTRPSGHGVGLHFCANAAVQMGGRISASSDGVDRGARFRLDLPTRWDATRERKAA